MYELMLVTAPSLETDTIIGKVGKIITENQGNGIKTERLGRKKLAYPIQKQVEAEYILVNFEAPTSAIIPISKKLRMEEEDLLRFLLVKSNPKATKAGSKVKIEEEKEEEEKKPKVTVVTKVRKTEGVKVSEVSPHSTESNSASRGKPIRSIRNTQGKPIRQAQGKPHAAKALRGKQVSKGGKNKAKAVKSKVKNKKSK